MIVIRWQIVPFRDRVRRGGVVGVSVLLADPGPLARSVVAGRQPTGARFVKRPREQPGVAAVTLKDDTRALRLKYDLSVDEIALDAISYDLRSCRGTAFPKSHREGEVS